MAFLDFVRCKQCSESPFKVCAGNPFARLFGEPDARHEEGTRRIPVPGRPRRLDGQGNLLQEEEIRTLVDGWSHFVHSRALDFFESQESLEKVLLEVARSLDRGSDPVCGHADRCMVWRGKSEANQAFMQVNKPREGDSQVWVNRILAFIFSSDASFLKLMKLPKEPFKMSCGNQLCVNLAHVTPAVTLKEASRVTAVTLQSLTSHDPGCLTVSCTSIVGTELARLEVFPEETTLANIRTTVARCLSVPPQTLRLLTRGGDVLPKASDDALLSSLQL